MLRVRSGLLLAVVAALSACGGGAGDSPPDAPVNRSVTQTVGPAGGVVAYLNGPTLFVPAGALSTSRSLTITDLQLRSAGNAPIFGFEPAGLTFDAGHLPTVAFPVPAPLTTEAGVYWSDAAAWEPLAGTVSSGKVTVQISHFSRGYAGPPCTVDESCTPPAPNDCFTGLRACNTGAPVCGATSTKVGDGTACSVGVCAAGTCTVTCHPVGLAGAPHADVAYLGTAEVPTVAGGTIQDGTYFETLVNVYGDVSIYDPSTLPTTAQDVWKVEGAGTVVKVARPDADVPGAVSRWTASAATTGTALTLTGTCGLTGHVDYGGYTATASELRVYYTQVGGDIWEYVFTKQ